jgi:hypothetical protein
MMRPCPRSYIFGSAARMSRKGDSTMSRRMRLNFAGSNSSIGATCWMPALLTRMSTSRLSSASDAVSLRSTCQASPPTSPASACAASPLRSATIVRAPAAAKARTHAAPIPLAPPVTSALRPLRSVMTRPFLSSARPRQERRAPAG